MKNMLQLLAISLGSVVLYLVLVCALCGCDAGTVGAQPDAHAPYRGPGMGIDGGAEAAALATLGLDGGTEAATVPDAKPITLDAQPSSDLTSTPDSLPAPDVLPACPYVSWTKPAPGSSSELRWTITMSVPAEATCFTTCGSLASLWLAQLPMRSVKINDVSALLNPTDATGYLPAVAAVDGLWVFRISSGDPGTLQIAGWPSNSTGSCP